ncbi:MAG: HK97 family phage prohead protease [Alphaproteobacteria bacterium]|nr:HK97 family phage prohead protease [Alphaproteobacteria bacterium]
MENKSIKFPSILVGSTDPQGYFSGYASVFNAVDNQNDMVLPGAFKDSLFAWEKKSQWPKMLWQHDQKEPIGRWLFMEEDSRGLYVEGQLLLDVQKAREAYALMKAGALEGLSIGYRVVKSKRDGKGTVRYIQQVDLLEVSVVTFAANQAAKITKVKKM